LETKVAARQNPRFPVAAVSRRSATKENHERKSTTNFDHLRTFGYEKVNLNLKAAVLIFCARQTFLIWFYAKEAHVQFFQKVMTQNSPRKK
jgi:hypothetical protein